MRTPLKNCCPGRSNLPAWSYRHEWRRPAPDRSSLLSQTRRARLAETRRASTTKLMGPGGSGSAKFDPPDLAQVSSVDGRGVLHPQLSRPAGSGCRECRSTRGPSTGGAPHSHRETGCGGRIRTCDTPGYEPGELPGCSTPQKLFVTPPPHGPDSKRPGPPRDGNHLYRRTG